MFKMKKLLFLLCCLIMVACHAPAPKEEKQSVEKPNIIFILADDHAYQAISAYDTTFIKTPSIDRLAREGMLFSHAFVTNSICSPSRAVILTGKFSHLNSVRDNWDVFDTTEITFPKLLQQHGYQTALYGKWHLKSLPKGFDYWKVLPDQGQYYQPDFLTPQGETRDTGYVTDIITDMAIHFLDSLRDPNKPFLLMVHHKAAHRDWWPSMQDITAFKDKKIPVPQTLFDTYVNRGKAASEEEMRIADHMALTMDNKLSPETVARLGYKEFMDWYVKDYRNSYNRLTDEEKTKWQSVYGPIEKDFAKNRPKGKALTLWKYHRYMEDYLGTIISVDRNVGRLLDYLDQHNLSKNTMVVYTSDQGFYLGEHGWFDKRFMYEQSFRTPLLIRYPALIQPGAVNNDLVQNLDFAETMLDVTGVPVPEDMQGRSLVPLFQNNNTGWRDALYYHYYEYPGIHAVKRHYGIRTARYKLIHFYYDIDEWEMYDLEKDPGEMKNIYNDPDYAAVRTDLEKRLAELRIQYKDSEELDKKFIASDLARFK